MTRTKLLFTLCISLFAIYANAQVASGISRGGSNFNWYTVVNCDPEPYGVVVNYNTQTASIRTELAKIKAAGQNNLRLMLFFGHGLSSGTLMDSTGGALSAQNMANLNGLLRDTYNYGFSEVEISFSPQGPNDPNQWTSLNSTMAAENWSVINSVHQGIQNPGLYRIYYDLGNEMMTTSQSNARYRYMKYIWPKYYALYSNLYDTVGFSFASGQISAISNMGAIYGHNSYPVMADVHIYPYGNNSAADILYAAAHNLATIGPVSGGYRFVIGEANFNNATDASSMALEINSLSSHDSKPFYLMQWPRDPANPNCPVADVSPFSNYIAHGF